MLAHFFGGDVLARGEDDDVLDPSLDEEIAVPVEMAQIAGVKPAVFYGLPGGGLILKIPGHNVVAPDQDLADAVGVGVENSDFHPCQGPARRPQAGSLRRVEGDHRRGLREAVALQHRKSQPRQVLRQRLGQFGPAADKKTKLLAQGPAEFPQQGLGGIYPQKLGHPPGKVEIGQQQGPQRPGN